MKLKSIILILAIFLCIFAIIILKNNGAIKKDIITYNAEELTQNEEKLQDLEVGKNAKISSIQILKCKTGTGPFDENDQPGNDSSENNNIVRSFDQITWTIEATMALKNTNSIENYQGGILEIQAEVPENCKNLVEWDEKSMAWAEEKNISVDGRIFTAKYTMPKQEKTVPGKQTLVLVLKVNGASNGLEVKPNITMNLLGNEEKEKQKIIFEKTIVSAAPSYNIKLIQNTELQKKLTVDYGEGNTNGRMYGYGINLQLYNENISKGLKGIEYPKGEITFDLNLKLERSILGSKELEDITNNCTPILWNYKINNPFENYGEIKERTMYWDNIYNRYVLNAPMGNKNNRTYSVYNSGNIKMTQEKEKIHVLITDYDFDGTFPIYNYHYPTFAHNSREYLDNIGCFSVGYFQIFVPDNQASTVQDRNYYLNVSDSNFKAKSISNVNTNTQVANDDDSCTIQHVIYKPGKYAQYMILRDNKCNKFITTTASSGDGYAGIETVFTLGCKFSMDINNDYDIHGADKFVKFDANCVEPVMFNNKEKYKTLAFNGTMKFDVYYVTKKDGTNWLNQDEMNNANIEDMELYKELSEIPNNKLCIGVFLESSEGYLATSSGDNNVVYLPVKVKTNAIIGQTYGFTQRTRYWKESLDRKKYSQAIKTSYNQYPRLEWDSGNKNYIKTEYNESGNIAAGTHSGGWQYGQSILVVGADMKINKEAIDEETSEKKINYDFSKNEYDVTYKLTPIINSYDNINITDAILKIEDNLPKEISYIPGSCNFKEPEIEKNDDGTTKLIWYIYGIENEKIDPIIYKAHIDETVENSTILNSTAIISEIPEIDNNGNKIYKIGNIIEKNRITEVSIQVINLSSYYVYKKTETSVIEKNGDMSFKIVCGNKTEDELNEFRLLDILPYNADSRGTAFNGTYKIKNINLKQIDTITNKEIKNNNIKILITEEKNVRNKITVKDENLELSNIWKNYISGEKIDKEITAILLAGSLKAKTKLEIDILIETSNNEAEDIYKNQVTVQTNKNTEEMQTSIVAVKTINRKIQGKVWEDSNKNGIIDKEEKYISNLKVNLLDDNENIIDEKTTDGNGIYKFEKFKKGKYKVKIQELDSNIQEITLKDVGINKEINNKFNSNGETDILDAFEKSDLPLIEEKYINAGIIIKKIEEKNIEEQEPEPPKNFNISIDKYIKNIIIDGKTQKIQNGKIEKIEVPNKKISKTDINIEYEVIVKNTSEIDSKVQIEEVIPEGLSLVEAKDWKKEGEKYILDLELKAGEEKTLQIKAKWNNSEENFGTKENIVKINEATNDLNLQETDLNDNQSKADLIISIKTGNTKINIIIGILIIIELIIIIIIKKKIKTISWIATKI